MEHSFRESSRCVRRKHGTGDGARRELARRGMDAAGARSRRERDQALRRLGVGREEGGVRGS